MAGAGGVTPAARQRDPGLPAAEFAARGARASTSSPRPRHAQAAQDSGSASAPLQRDRDRFRRRRATSAGTPTQTLPRAATQQITVTWQADDPDGDRLVYNVYFRGEDETQWKLLAANLHDNSVTFDADVLADGKYYFRVVASDREANPPATAREAS